MRFGLDLLAVAKYPKQVREVPTGWALGCFSSTFGDSRLAVVQYLRGRADPLVRVQLLWKDRHDFSDKDVARAAEEAKKWVPIGNELQEKLYISPWCEHKANSSLIKKLRAAIKKVLPHCTYVNTPMKGGAYLDGEVNEVHGEGRPLTGRYTFSYDGYACVDSDVEAIKEKHKKAEVFFFWEPRFNGRWEDNDNTPRPERDGWPDGKLIRSVVNLANSRGECSLPKDAIWKSHSENKDGKDSRAEKPVLIIKVKAKEFVLKDNDVRVRARLPYYGTFHGGGYRYYCPKWGYEIGKVPFRLFAGGVEYGTINTGFRFGTFR